ncbi:MAG: PaaI family thioesterase [Sphingobium sp.]|nr:PaaI family thioesterase [Sphingobium sp.]
MAAGRERDEYGRGVEAPLCGGCRDEGRCRFGIGTMFVTGQEARAAVRCPASSRGGPSIAHGGWIAAVFDDLVGRMLIAQGIAVVTSSLKVDFLKPTPVEEDLIATVRSRADGERRWVVTAKLALAMAPDRALAEATALMIEPRPGHYQRHADEIAAYRAKERPLSGP